MSEKLTDFAHNLLHSLRKDRQARKSVKLQAVFRGHQARKKQKAEASAIRIQTQWRGHVCRVALDERIDEIDARLSEAVDVVLNGLSLADADDEGVESQ